MDKLTLLQSCSIAQYSTDAETLAQAIANRPAWMQPLATSSHLWILRGEKSGDLTLLESSRFAKDLSESGPTGTNRLRNLPAEIAEKWLSNKYLQMRQM